MNFLKMKKCFYILFLSLTFTFSYAQRPFPLGLPTCLEDDFRELEKLYDATGGSSWTNKTNWLTSNNMANWSGITLTPSGCDVQYIFLSGNNLVGTLPMLSFPELLRFSGWGNALSGSIPNFNMPKLVDFNFQDQNTNGGGFTGSIPNFNMPNLQTLHLWGNKLTGTIPNFNMSNLVTLWLDVNQLSGSIPNFNMPKLEGLTLAANQLSGNIPNFNMPVLKKLILINNKLSGNIPNFSMPMLTVFQLTNNLLTGSIPNFNMPLLIQLYLNNNLISGSVPNFNMPKLENFHFYGNKIDSCPNFTNLPSLKKDTIYTRGLRAYSNKLTFDDILPNTGFATTATFIYTPQDSIYKDTTFTQTTGDNLTIDLGIDGAITDNSYKWFKNGSLYRTTTTNKLPLSNLQLTDAGVYTCQVTNPRAPLLTLFSRKIIIAMRSSCRTSDSLELIKLYNATNGANWINKWDLTKSIDTWYGVQIDANGCVINIILTNNNLTGVLPDLSLSNLINLAIGQNKISGEIPSLLGCTKLQQFAAWNNSFTGKIPSFLGFQDFFFLNLSNNLFDNQIPTFNSKITGLFLDGCNLSGKLPNLEYITRLFNLNLSNNNFSDTIPNFNLPNLYSLDLNNNKLSGRIPNFNMPNLQILNLYQNKIDSCPSLSNLLSLKKDTIFQRGLRIFSNKLTFDDILPNIGFATTATFIYSPQDSIYKDTTFTQNTGDNLTIDLGIDGAITDNNYKWFKNGSLYRTTTTNKLPLSNLQLTDAGVYTCQVTNPRAPLLTLYSRKITVVVNSSCRSRDSLALIDLYNATGGANWTNKWDLTKPYSTWYGIQTDANGCVTSVDLDGDISSINGSLAGNGLSGTLPISINTLTNLQNLSLSNNKLIGGTIPLITITSLKTLFLHSNKFTGTIPSFNLPNLDVLNLSANSLQNNIPNFNLPILRLLYLDGNTLIGNIPNFNLPNLELLSMYNNQLIGFVPNFNMPKLMRLTMSNNQLTGVLPSFNMPNLELLQFSNNRLDSVPNLSALPIKKDTIYSLGFRSQSNRLTFDDILPNIGFATSATYIYTPQDSIYKDTTINLTTNSTLTIDLAIDGALTTNKYVWFKNGIRFDSSNTNKLILRGVSPCDAATYTVQVTNPAAPLLTLYSRKAKVIVMGSTATRSIDTTICYGTNYRLPSGKVVSVAGNYTDTMRNIRNCDSLILSTRLSISPFVSTITQTTVLCSGQTYTLPNGQVVNSNTTYRDTIRNQNGCDSFRRVIIITTGSNPTTTSLNPSICRGQSYTLPNGQIVTPSVNTTYRDTLKSYNGCDSVRRITTISVNSTSILPNQNTNLCLGRSLTLPSGRILTPNAAMTLTDTVRGRTGCDSLIQTFNISVSPVATTTTQTPILCNGQTYTLPNDQIVSTTTNYRDTVRNQNGCDSLIRIINITKGGNATTTSLNPNICRGQNYTLPSGQIVTPSVNTTYRDTLKSYNGCDSVIRVVNVIVNSLPSLTPVISNISCNGQNNGSITLTTIGGTPNYTYNWSSPNGFTSNSQNISNLKKGDYKLTVTDSKGCTATTSLLTITEPDPLSIGATTIGNDSCQRSKGNITITSFTGGNGNLSFLWSNGATTQNLKNIGAGNYTLTVTDSRNCKATNSFVVQNKSETVAPIRSVVLCPKDSFQMPISQKWVKIAKIYYDTTYNQYGCYDIRPIQISFHQKVNAQDDEAEIGQNQTETTIEVLKNDSYPANLVDVNIKRKPVFGTIDEKGIGIFNVKMPRATNSTVTFTYEICHLSCANECDTALVKVLIKNKTAQDIISTAITPNEDGYNDKLDFPDIDWTKYPNNEIEIFNRWGQRIFYAQPYQRNWKGLNDNGQELPAGDYFFILRLNIAEKILVGGVYLQR